MRELLNELAIIYLKLNKRFDEKLIDKTEIEDVIEILQDDFENDYSKIKIGIDKMKKMDLSMLNSPNDEAYLDGMIHIYSGLLEMKNYFEDLREIHIKISKKFRYISGEITLEEYLDDGIIKLEDADDETEDL